MKLCNISSGVQCHTCTIQGQIYKSHILMFLNGNTYIQSGTVDSMKYVNTNVYYW